jgi:hypothetical protein
MDLKRSGAQRSQKGPVEHFTGTVRIDPLFQQSAPARASGAYVTFEPCSRSDWHTHPLGQTRRRADDGDDAHRDSRVARGKERRVAREGH